MCQFKILLSFLLCFCCASGQKEKGWWNKKAEIMVKNQLENRGIQDERILQIMRKTPRHLFIPENLRNLVGKLHLVTVILLKKFILKLH